MAKRSCNDCRKRDAIIAMLQQRVAELEARLGMNSSNSSLPPSQNPPNAPPPVTKTTSGRQRGAQPGHAGPVLLRLPPQRLSAVVPFVPTTCQRCHAPLPAEASPADPEPTWHQVAELPPQVVHVTEYQGHARTCGQCGTLNHAAIPADLRVYRFGPRLTAALSYLSGCHHVSRRGIVEVVQTVLDFPVSLATVSRLEQETSQALQGAHAEAVQAVRQAGVKHVDETGWKKAGQRCWLWAAATAGVAAFVLYAGRGVAGLTTLLGTTTHGIICSDRWSVYQGVAVAYRQLCWAHLKRDFQAMVDRGNSGSAVGTDLLLLMDGVFIWWYRVRDGTLQRRTLQRRVQEVREDFRAVLRGGGVRQRQDGGDVPGVAGGGRSPVDVRARRGCGTDQQSRRADAASGGAVAKELVGLSE